VLTVTCEAWLKRDPQNEAAHRLLAVGSVELDHRAVALREFGWLIEHAYSSPDAALESFGRSLGDLRNAAGVAAIMRELARRHSGSAVGHEQAGNLMLIAGDAGGAYEEGRLATDLGRRRTGRALMARALVVLGDCGRGLELVTALGSDQRPPERMTEAWLLVACGRGAEAEGILQELLQHPGERTAALESLAGRELDARRHDAAARHYNELSTAQGGREAAQFGLATLAERSGDSVRALSMYSSLTSGRQAVPAQLRAYRLRAAEDGIDWADRMLDDFVYAVPTLRQQITVGRIIALSDLGFVDRALALAVRAERAYPDDEELIRAHAEVLVRAGRTDAAISLLEALLKARPQDPAAQNALGYTLVDAGHDLRRADRLIAAAIAQSPDHPAYLDSLGWLQYRKKDYRASADTLAHAYRLQSDPEVAAHFVDALYAAGRGDAGAAVLRAAVERYPTDPHLLQAVARHPDAPP
jgi:Flp pilus assembly protein TadD